MSVCARCHSYTCSGGCYYSIASGKCKSCKSYSCRGNCSIGNGIKAPTAMVKCAVCGLEYMRFHTALECKAQLDKRKYKF